MYKWWFCLGFLLLLVYPTRDTHAQEAEQVRVSLIPEEPVINEPGPATLIVVINNPTADEIQIDSFNFANAGSIQSIQPLPNTVIEHNTATALYQITVPQGRSLTFVGHLRYVQNGTVRTAITQATIELQEEPDDWRDFWLVFIGAVAGILGGVTTEVVKGWIDDRRLRQRQAEKASSILLPTMDICLHAIEQNREAPLDAWKTVFFNEGLYSAFAQRAKKLKQADLPQTLAILYARITDYNLNKDLIDRSDLIDDLGSAINMLRTRF